MAVQRHGAGLALAIACGMTAAQVSLALGTAAGTTISNQAQISYDVAGAPQSAVSNVAAFAVAEVIDVNLLVQTLEQPVQSGAPAVRLRVTVTNLGNGFEAFVLTLDAAVPGDQFDPVPASPAIYFDTDGSGSLTGGDVAYQPGGNDPLLGPDESLDVFVVNDIPGGLTDGDIGMVALAAAAVTGTGAPGDTIVGAGDGGVDAVFGAGGATGGAAAQYLIRQVSLSLAKSAVVTDPGGGAQPVPGATIAYSILVSAAGTGQALGAVFTDAIPTDTTYEPGSLRVNGISMTDGDDADAGAFDAVPPRVRVNLGDIGPGDPAQQISFNVTID